MKQRLVVIAGLATCAAALAALVTVGVSLASARRVNAAPNVAQAAASARRPILTPFLHPAPSGLKPYLGRAGTASPWTALAHQPPIGTPGTMLLESDGTVLVHDEPDNNTTAATPAWYKLTPNSKGSYINGTWSQIASMPSDYGPLYFGSAVLPDGRMIVEGGEYNITGKGVWTNLGAIYNPVTNAWAPVPHPPGWTNIGDAASEVLPDGTFMLEHPCNTCTTNPEFTVDDALLNANTMKWTVIPGLGKEDPNDEEGWTLEPSGQLLTVEAWAVGSTQLFNPSNDQWTFSGDTALKGNPLNPFPIVEIGPQAEMPGGNTFVVGAGTSTQEYPTPCTDDVPAETALYHYKAGTTGTWSAGPAIPLINKQEYSATDGPASTLPDGNVLFDASACTYNIPTHFFVYNANSNTISQIPDASKNAPNDTSFATRMLALPNGQVLYNDGTNLMEVYTAGGTPKVTWDPSVTSLSSTTLAPGSTYSLSGNQLAGLDQGAAYGDDVQDSTNFPLVRITNSATGVVTYARTSDWTSVSVNPGTSSSTKFTLPSTTPAGASTLVVVANGIASAPQSVTVS